MSIDKTKVKKILVIGLSNIGDAVLTTPVIQSLRDNFPQAHLAVFIGPRAFKVFKSDSRIDSTIIYDKKVAWKNKWALFNKLRRDKYDLVVDLRNTVFNLFLNTRYHSSFFKRAPKSLVRMKDRHLWKIKSLGLPVNETQAACVQYSPGEEHNVEQMFKRWQLNSEQVIVAIAAGARNMTKRWQKSGFRQLIEALIKQCGVKIIMVGDEQDELLVEEIVSGIKPGVFNACGKTTIGELACLLSKTKLLVSNDSAPMHLSWAVNTPVVALFGPTDYKKYGPCGARDIVVHKQMRCVPCEVSLCPKGTRECLKTITAEEVLAACKKILKK